jgi:hypothetical protein
MGFWATAMDGIVGNLFGGAVTAGAVYATIKFERRSRVEAIELEHGARVEAQQAERLARARTATTLAVTDLHRDAWDLLTAIDGYTGSEPLNPRQGVGTSYSVVLAHAIELWPHFANRIRANIAAMFMLNAELARAGRDDDRDGEPDGDPDQARSRIRRVVADIAELCRTWLEDADELEARLAADPTYLRGTVDGSPGS